MISIIAVTHIARLLTRDSAGLQRCKPSRARGTVARRDARRETAVAMLDSHWLLLLLLLLLLPSPHLGDTKTYRTYSLTFPLE
jgi:hypothetical protein